MDDSILGEMGVCFIPVNFYKIPNCAESQAEFISFLLQIPTYRVDLTRGMPIF